MSELFPSPAADFDHPLDILDGCHERIRRQCRLIERIRERLATSGADSEARDAARAVMRYFDSAGANHHRDEEDDLFPALLGIAAGAPREALEALIGRLREEHAALEASWIDMRASLLEISDGRDVSLELAAVRAFGAAYERHIAIEEAQLFPLARELLGAAEIARLGASMAERRGVKRPAR
jgi:hemerythrin-like domain-containing protein